jgi:N-acetylmuramic acid 6-phosphate etherase
MVTTTESPSHYDNLEQMTVKELLENINHEDSAVPAAVNKILPQIEQVVEKLIPRIKKGGRLFYIGSGTSGRLGILDASEIPPTFGIAPDTIIGIIAGGDKAIRKAVESAEDDEKAGWIQLQKYEPTANDSIIGLSASGTAPYVISAIKQARKEKLFTACITCNSNSPLAKEVDVALEPIVGPEFVTGSTRMKAGTAQKLILNMITTSLMIQLGKVKGNKMVDMKLTNKKLVARGSRMIAEELGLPMAEAKRLLMLHGSVREAVDCYKSNQLVNA